MSRSTLAALLATALVGCGGASDAIESRVEQDSAAALDAAAASPLPLAWSPSTNGGYAFLASGTVMVQTFTLTYPGSGTSGSLSVELSGSSAFTLTADGCTGAKLRQGRSCSVTVRYAPSSGSNQSERATLTARGGNRSGVATLVLTSVGIVCSSPADGSMINVAPGSPVTFQGAADDLNGLTSVTVNGAAATVASDGTFSLPMTTRFGVNFADVSVTDGYGMPVSRLCAFTVANQWANPLLTDAVSLVLTPGAIDDGVRADGLDDLGAILNGVANDQGPGTVLSTALRAANPLKPLACDSETCTFLGCVCWYRSGVTVVGSQVPGPNTVSLALVNGGLRAHATFHDVSVQLDVSGDAGGISYDVRGWVTYASVDVDLTLDTAISAGRPRLTVRPGSVSATVGDVSTAFAGLDGFIQNNIVVPLANDALLDLVRDQLQSYVQNNFTSALDALVSTLDVTTVGSTFNVPRLDGSGNLAVAFGGTFSTVDATAQRLLFGMGTQFSTAAANTFPSLGAALPQGALLLAPTLTSPQNAAATDHVGIFNQALHALWRGGYFAVTIPGSTIASTLPAGTQVTLDTRLPPVAAIAGDGTFQVQLGAIHAKVTYPGLPPELPITLGASAHTQVALSGNRLVPASGGIVVDELHVSSDALPLSTSDLTTLDTVLQPLVQLLVARSLNALPALPIPNFTIPASLAQFGFTSGQQLGVTTPTLTKAQRHFVLGGAFGVR